MLMRLKPISFLCILFISFGSFALWSSSCSKKLEQGPIAPPFLSIDTPWADSMMTVMSPDERIAQLFMIAANSPDGEEQFKKVDTLVADYGVGGLVFFKGHPTEQLKLTNRFQYKARIPLMVGIDGEWGLSMRLDSTIRFPWMMTQGAIQGDSLVYEMGAEIARQCKRIGVHVNFGPVVDVNNNPENPIINSRSFGEDIYNVTRKGLAYMKGMQDNNVLASAKHFPGHGDTNADSHKTLPLIPYDRNRLDSLEIYPYHDLIDNGLGSVMVAHLNIPALDSTQRYSEKLKENFQTPSTLSPYVVDSLLQKELGFRGLIITDALNMKGVSKFYEPGDVDVEAIKAGNDILLIAEDVPKALAKIKQAIADSVLLQSEIDRRCHKILKAKEWMNIHEFDALEVSGLYEDLNSSKALLLERKITAASLTVLENKNQLLPLKDLKHRKIACLSFGENDNSTWVTQLQLYAEVDEIKVYEPLSIPMQKKLLKKLKAYDTIIIGIHKSNANPWKSYQIKKTTKNLIAAIPNKKDLIVDVFANPYSMIDFKDLKDVDAVVMSYQNSHSAQDLSAQLIFGGIGANGRLPVSVPGMYALGFGIDVNDIGRLQYTIPEELGFDAEAIVHFDSLAMAAIEMEATPGCQLLIAQKGKVFYNKSFGYHTYDKKNKVKNADVYDVASVTKIAATVPSLMFLVEENKFDLDQPIKNFIEMPDTCNKASLLTREILTHQARLQPWIPFYRNTLTEKGNLIDSLYSKKKNKIYPHRVAENLYLHKSYPDTLMKHLLASKLREEKGYKYSDLGYYMLKEAIETIEGKPLDLVASERLYENMGANMTMYHPRERLPLRQIIPTENDTYYRNQLLRGDVHDMGAAMQNGVGGHAGLFSNANDLAKLMQMYLQKGYYGGDQYFKPSTVDEFTSCQYCDEENRRGIGFDKPVIDDSDGPTCGCVSLMSYGHTGFTGTMVWADPETDLLYIFLSNRVNPDAENWKLVKENVRTNIQQAIYDVLP
mgnify:CR=1 FL=1